MELSLSSTSSIVLVYDESKDMSSEQLAEYLNEDIRKVVLPTIIFVGIEMLLGFIGNLLVLYVFSFRYRVCNYKYFVLSLAVIDIFTTVTTMPGEIITQIYWYVYSAPLLCKMKSFCNVFTLTAEALCLLAIAVDRYRKVCQPLAWQIKAQQTKFICLIIPLVSALVALPTPFLWGERTLTKTFKNITGEVTICEKDEKFETTNYPLIYISLVSCVITSILLSMLCSYTYVLVAIIKERRLHKTMRLKQNIDTNPGVLEVSDKATDTSDVEKEDVSASSSSQQQLKIKHVLTPWRLNSTRLARRKRVRSKTMIMFSVTLAFIVTTIVYLILVSIIASSDDILQTLSDVKKAVYFFFLRLYFINHVINPFIYGVMDPKFKESLMLIINRITSRV